MAKTSTFNLEEMKPGYFLAWTVTTQCMYTYNITLKAGNTVIFSANKLNYSPTFQLISQDIWDYCDGNLVLTITCYDAAQELKSSTSSGSITDTSAKTVGYVYSICIEDAGDADYNDVYINIVGWKKKG